ncbi:MAG: T9SS type A sorting domain-containing protein [Bacteroidales bacterium]|nr:T9SS type A sorting domain-containing protein [Bacteroidales bacterium]
MKAKITILSLLIFLIVITMLKQTKSQSTWFPEGATWYYGCTSFAMEGYQKLYYTKDTIIKGLEFKTIASLHVIYDFINASTNTYLNEEAYFLREDSNIVYWYHQNLDTIYTLYNFNSSIGDTWKIPPDPIATENDTAFYGSFTIALVDSIDHVVINGDSLKRIFLTYSGSSTCYYGGTGSYCIGNVIVEKMGALAWLFPTSTYIMDLYTCGSLRCYEDISFPLHNFYPSTPCDFTVGIENHPQNSTIKIYPNPTNNYVDITGLKPGITMLEVNDIYGRILLQKELTQESNRVCLKGLYNGILFFHLIYKDEIYIEKIIKFQ